MAVSEIYRGPDFKNSGNNKSGKQKPVGSYTVADQAVGFGLSVKEVTAPPAGLPLDKWAELGLSSAKEKVKTKG